jgi:hypothetical protein
MVTDIADPETRNVSRLESNGELSCPSGRNQVLLSEAEFLSQGAGCARQAFVIGGHRPIFGRTSYC